MEGREHKAGVDPEVRATLKWDRDLVFTGTTRRGYDLSFDARVEWGCTPVEALLLSLAGCMAIDVVAILGKMRCAPTALETEVAGTRRTEPPQHFTRVRLVFRLSGPPEMTREKVDQALALSMDRYCSVRHTLRPDLEIETVVEIGGAGVSG